MGVVERRGSEWVVELLGGGVDIDVVGLTERFPEVMYGVMSKTSGKMRRMVFLVA